MIAVKRAETDEDLDAWLRVRRAVTPNESAGTVDLLRRRESPEHLLVLASLDGELAGSGTAERSALPDRFSVAPRVLPAARRRGVGTALLRRLAEHAGRFGVEKLSAIVEDDGSRAFGALRLQ